MLRKYIELPNGIPSPDTINRTISAIDPKVMQERFVEWVRGISERSKGEVVSIDGKRLRGSGQDGKEAIVHMVSTWSDVNNMVLGSYKVDNKSNEITAIPKLLEILDLGRLYHYHGCHGLPERNSRTNNRNKSTLHIGS